MTRSLTTPQVPENCRPCRTPAGCDKHRIFTCATCGNPTWWQDGAADDRPNDCSDCWATWYDPMQVIADGLFSLLGTITPGFGTPQ